MSSDSLTVRFYPSGNTAKVPRGIKLLQAAEFAGVNLRFPCGGKGRCGKCKVVFQQGAPTPTSTEQNILNETELYQGYRLGCTATIDEDATIVIPDSLRTGKVLTTGTSRSVARKPGISKIFAEIPEPTVDDLRSDLCRLLDAMNAGVSQSCIDPRAISNLGSMMRSSGFKVTGVFADGEPIAFEPGDTTDTLFGVAIDIGTTTIAAYLLDLNTAEQVSVASAMNPQAQVGDDVISRISYTMENSDGLEKLRSSVVEIINKLLVELAEDAEITTDSIYEMTVVGNTCMSHLFLGLDPQYLAMAPYVPVISRSLCIDARQAGLDINPFGRVYILPNIAGYVGADSVGVVLASAINEKDELTLAVDIGTNGEIVLGSKSRMVACSTAAGPAFEGAHISHGMRAAQGAIDAVWIDDGNIGYSTIGGAKSSGICGSGLLDAIVCMVNAGILESSGRIVDSEEVPEEFSLLSEKVQAGERGNEFLLVTADESSTGEPIVVTQRDVREVQLAKGAIAAGIQTLMAQLGIGADDLDKVILAGAFGNYVRKESAISSGMIPNVPLSKIHSVGNAAGEGAKLALISTDIRHDADRIAESIEYIELTTDMAFQERFADALMFERMVNG